MGYLERVFLGTLLLFALLILFMFGLYFDIGSMMQSAMQRSGDATGPSGFSRAADQLERSAIKPEVTVRDVNPRGFTPAPAAQAGISAGDANFLAIFAKCATAKPPPGRAELIDRKRKELAAKGFGQDYIEMEVLSMESTAMDDIEKQVNPLVTKGDYDAAERALLEILATLDGRDLMTMQKVRMKLQHVYFDSNQLDKYRETMKLVFDTEEKILALQAGSRLMDDKRTAEGIKQEQADLGKKRQEFDSWFEQISSQAKKTGHPNKMDEATKVEVKAGLLREQEAGRISPKALQEALGQLEQLEKRADAVMRR